jgi:hypothetical protein
MTVGENPLNRKAGVNDIVSSIQRCIEVHYTNNWYMRTALTCEQCEDN